MKINEDRKVQGICTLSKLLLILSLEKKFTVAVYPRQVEPGVLWYKSLQK